MARFADITGWRGPSEVLTLQWRQVDFGSGQVRLDPGTTKNGEGRVFPMTAALRELVEAQRAERNRLRAESRIPLPVRLPPERRAHHSVHEGVEDGVSEGGVPGADSARPPAHRGPQPGAGWCPGAGRDADDRHDTLAVFERYNIVSETDLADAVRRLDERTKEWA